jgi:ribosomal protein S14
MGVSSQRRRITGALLLAGVIAAIGFLIGEYAPFTGGLASIAEPFSPVRDETAYGYAVAGSILGAVLGLLTTERTEGREERACPHCAEPILAQAKLCKHCRREVSAPGAIANSDGAPDLPLTNGRDERMPPTNDARLMVASA